MNGFLASLPAADVGYFAVRAAVALVLGAAVGLERQWRQRTAGLRTNALVALGAALFEEFAVLLSGAHGVDPSGAETPQGRRQPVGRLQVKGISHQVHERFADQPGIAGIVLD